MFISLNGLRVLRVGQPRSLHHFLRKEPHGKMPCVGGGWNDDLVYSGEQTVYNSPLLVKTFLLFFVNIWRTRKSVRISQVWILVMDGCSSTGVGNGTVQVRTCGTNLYLLIFFLDLVGKLSSPVRILCGSWNEWGRTGERKVRRVVAEVASEERERVLAGDWMETGWLQRIHSSVL